MKTLYLLRHAHSPPGPPLSVDHARPLSPEGRKQAEAVRDFMTAEKLIADLVLSSDAARTFETAEIVGTTHVAPLPGLYLVLADDILSIIHTAPDDIDNLMIVGHNPSIAELSLTLGGDESLSFRPATLVIFSTTAESWALLSPENTKMEKSFTP